MGSSFNVLPGMVTVGLHINAIQIHHYRWIGQGPFATLIWLSDRISRAVAPPEELISRKGRAT